MFHRQPSPAWCLAVLTALTTGNRDLLKGVTAAGASSSGRSWG
jgi:hypothetical protein